MEKIGKRILETWLLRICVGVCIGIVALLPAHAFISTWAGSIFGAELVWKSWKEIIIAMIIPVAGLYCWLRPDITRVIWSRAINKMIMLYVILHFILSIFSIASFEAIAAGLLMNLRFLALFVLVQIVVASQQLIVESLRRVVPIWLLWIAIVLSVMAILQVTFVPKDFLTYFGYSPETIAPYTLVDDNPSALRAFATMRGPNTLGAYLLLPLTLALYLLYKKQHQLLSSVTLALGLLALVATGSRSAWLGFAAAVVTLGFMAIPKARSKQWLLWAAIPTLVLGAIILMLTITIPAVRLAIFHSSPEDPYLLEGSTEQHWLATASGTLDVWIHPLGQGVGSAGPASFYNTNSPANISENYFVQIAQEAGIAALILFIGICWLVLRYLRGSQTVLAPPLIASFVGLSVTCLFLHTWADDPTAMTWWALAALVMTTVTPQKP